MYLQVQSSAPELEPIANYKYQNIDNFVRKYSLKRQKTKYPKTPLHGPYRNTWTDISHFTKQYQ